MDALVSAGLPPGWQWARLDDVCNVCDYEREPVKREDREARCAGKSDRDLVPYYGATGQAGWIDAARSSGPAILLGEDGAPFLEAGKAKAYRVAGRYWVNNHAHILRVRDPRLEGVILHQLNILDYTHFVSGTTRLKLTSEAMRRIPIAIPPAAEADRLTQAIDALFEEVEAGEAALARAREGLTQFRASLLHAACTGALTADWRAVNPSTAVTEGDAGLPLGWRLVPVAATGCVQLGRQRAPQHHDGPHMRPYLRVANVFEDRIDTTDVMRMNFTPDEFVSYRLELGDILLNEGQSAELVGRPAMFRGEIEECCFTNTLVRYRAGPLVDRDFALLVFRWWLRTGTFQRIAKITTNIAHLGAGRFGELLMPVPPMEEQVEIVRRASDLLAEVTDDTLVLGRPASALRQSILHAAFTGRLVPQDPADEPAAALLARLRAAPAAPRRTRQRRTTAQPDLIETTP